MGFNVFDYIHFLSLVLRSAKSFTSRKIVFFSVTEVFKVYPQCLWHGLTVKQLGLLPNGKQFNWSNLKKSCLLGHKEIKIKINEMFNNCFTYIN